MISYNSQEIFNQVIDSSLTRFEQHKVLKASLIDTKLGPMIAISDDNALYLIEFIDRKNLDKKVAKLKHQMKATIIQELTNPIQFVQAELKSYFNGTLIKFKTPINLLGTNFQKLAWNELLNVPYGEVRTYADQSKAIGKQGAFRAVANANGANRFIIIVPCHRIINKNGNLGGYSNSIERKKWLLDHENKYFN